MTFVQTDTFKVLKDNIKGDVIDPTDSSYEDSLKRWSKLAEKKAGAVIFVKTNSDVAEVIRFAVKHGIDLAIKGKFSITITDGQVLAR
jgi:FAD/FMN-containing dehydrogenase